MSHQEVEVTPMLQVITPSVLFSRWITDKVIFEYEDTENDEFLPLPTPGNPRQQLPELP